VWGTYKDTNNTDYTLSVVTISVANSNKSLSSILNILESICTNLKLLGSLTLPPLDNGTLYDPMLYYSYSISYQLIHITPPHFLRRYTYIIITITLFNIIPITLLI